MQANLPEHLYLATENRENMSGLEQKKDRKAVFLDNRETGLKG